MALTSVITPPEGGGLPANTTPAGTPDIHGVFTALAGEIIGVSLLAVFADLNDDLGHALVAVMIGWFLMFLIINASGIHTLVGRL